jgi:hypothetical protein
MLSTKYMMARLSIQRQYKFPLLNYTERPEYTTLGSEDKHATNTARTTLPCVKPSASYRPLKEPETIL